MGSVGQLLNEQAGIAEHREYDSFGAIDAMYSSLGGIRPTTSLRFSEVAHAGRLWDDQADLYFNQARWYDPHAGRFVGEDPAGFADGPNPFQYAGNDPINTFDPTGLSQAGNPLNNLLGGYSGNVIAPAKDAFFNSTLGGFIDYGPSLSAVRPTNISSQTLNLGSIGRSALNVATSTLRAANPVATSVINAGLGLGVSSLNTVTPVISEFSVSRLTSLFNTRSENLQRREQELQQRQHQEALYEASLIGLHGRNAQRSAMQVLDQRMLQAGPPPLPELVAQTNSRLSNEVLRFSTGLTSEEAALGITKGIIRATGQDVRRSDEFYVQQPGFHIIQGGVETGFNPLTYAPLLASSAGFGELRLLDNGPALRTTRLDTHAVGELARFQQLTREIDVLPNQQIISQIDTLKGVEGYRIGGAYSYMVDPPSVGPYKPFTAAQKRQLLSENRTINYCITRSSCESFD